MEKWSCDKLKLKLYIQVFTELRDPAQLIETVIMCWFSTYSNKHFNGRCFACRSFIFFEVRRRSSNCQKTNIALIIGEPQRQRS